MQLSPALHTRATPRRSPAARCCPRPWPPCCLAWRAPAGRGVTRRWPSVSPASSATGCAPARQRRQVSAAHSLAWPGCNPWVGIATGGRTRCRVRGRMAFLAATALVPHTDPSCWAHFPAGAGLTGNVLEQPLRRTLYLASRSTDKRLAGAAGAAYVFLQRAAAASLDADCRAKVGGESVIERGGGRWLRGEALRFLSACIRPWPACVCVFALPGRCF